MKNIFLVCAVFALLVTGCGDQAVQTNPPSSSSDASGVVEVTEVNKDSLATTLAANELTLVDFGATW